MSLSRRQPISLLHRPLEHDVQCRRAATTAKKRLNNDTLSVTGVVIYLIGQIGEFVKGLVRPHSSDR